MLSVVLLPAATLLAAAGAVPSDCPRVVAGELTRLSYDAFDTNGGARAWRTLLNKGCVDAAVATIQAYRSANAARMTAEQKEESSFHIGQALAMSGREPESAEYFASAAGPRSAALWAAYVEATLGFVRKDRRQLESALAAYEKNAGPQSMRLMVIRGLLRCFDRPYRDAMHCGM